MRRLAWFEVGGRGMHQNTKHDISIHRTHAITIRMHAMHGVVLLALLGFILSAGRLMMTLASEDGVKPTSGASLGLMALFCGLLTGLCVKSFIEARKKRQSETAEPTE